MKTRDSGRICGVDPNGLCKSAPMRTAAGRIAKVAMRATRQAIITAIS